jgi:hypothetical protein
MIPSLSADQMDKQLLKLSAEQMRSLNMMERNPRLRVTGGPGSGKTLLVRTRGQAVTPQVLIPNAFIKCGFGIGEDW